MCRVKHIPTRVSEAATVAAVAAAVITDLAIHGVGDWWNRHSFISSLVSSALILAVTVLVVNEVLSRRQIRERNRVAAVQALIVYTQVLRTDQVVMASPDEQQDSDVAGEVRALGSMVLIAAPALFDDPEARDFMEQAERFSALLVRIGLSRPGQGVTDADRDKLSKAKDAMSAAVQPLLARLPRSDVTAVEEDDPAAFIADRTRADGARQKSPSPASRTDPAGG
jgi:hypothetical protein